MAFIMALTPTFRAKITVEILNENGRLEKSDFFADFKRCDLAKLDELRTIPQRDVIREVLVGWDGLLDESKQPVPYNEATREALLSIPQATFKLIEEFWISAQGAKAKN